MISRTLPNGLSVRIDARGPADVAAVYLWIDVGSGEETEGLWGAAHFVEHLVFKGTESFGVGEVAAAVEDVGGDLNAWTSFDETVFHATVPSAHAPRAVQVLAEMMRTARFDAAELERERAVIVEEIRGGQDEPEMVVGEALYAAAYGPHPYGRPVIGTVASVRSMDRLALMRFYEENYQPANAALVVVGPVDAAAVLAAAERWLGRGGPRPTRTARPSPSVRTRRRTVRRGFDTTMVDVGWPVPGVTAREVPGLDLLVGALGGGASSPIEARLRLREGLCVAASAGLDAERDGGMVVVSLHPREGRTDDALAALDDEIARARSGSLTDGDLSRARAQLRAERVFGRETVDGRAHTLAFHLQRFGDPEAWRAYDAALEAVDATAVRELAQTWLAPERAIRIALLPDADPAPTRRRATPRPVQGDEPRSLRLPNGVRVLLQPEDAEVAAVRIAGLGGSLFETRRTAGLATAWSRALLRGAGRRGAEDFAAAGEGLAGGVGATAGRSTQSVRGEFTARTFDAGLDLLLDLVLQPRFDASEVEAIKAEQIEALSERDDHPEEHLGELVSQMAFPGDPWSLPALGWPATVRGITPARLAAYHARWCRGGNLVVAVTGAFEVDRVVRMLQNSLGAVVSGEARIPPPPRPARPGRGARRAGREQAHVAIAYPGVCADDPAQPALEYLMAVLGGQAGRLFVELREAWGLAYAVSASSQEGVGRGVVVCALSTDPERADEAERRLAVTLDRVRREGVSRIEFDRARTWLEGGIVMDLQTASSRARHLAVNAVLGLGEGDVAGRLRQRVASVDHAAVNTMAGGILSSPVAVARVLPRAKVA